MLTFVRKVLLAEARKVPPSKYIVAVPLPLLSSVVTSVPPVRSSTVPVELPELLASWTRLTLATAGPGPPPIWSSPREAPLWPTRISSSGWLKVPPEMINEAL